MFRQCPTELKLYAAVLATMNDISLMEWEHHVQFRFMVKSNFMRLPPIQLEEILDN